MENKRNPENQRTGYSYRNLDLWQRAQELARQMIGLSEKPPSTPAASVIARQIARSAASVGANIAEGHGRYSLAAYRHHLSIAKGSAAETDSWLDLLHRCGYIDGATEGELHNQCLTLLGALTRRIQAVETRIEQARASGIREEQLVYQAGQSANPEAPN